MTKVIFETKQDWLDELAKVNSIPLKKCCANCEHCSTIEDGRNVCLQHTMEVPKGCENQVVTCDFYIEDKCPII